MMDSSLAVAHFAEDSSREPVLVDVGTCNALGLDPHQTWAFRRAELTAFVESPFRLPSGNVLSFGRVRQLDPRLVGVERVVALAVRALDAIGGTLAKIPREAKLGLFLCLPARCDLERGDRSGRQLRRRLESAVVGPFLERGFDVVARSVARGHASLAYAALDVGRMLEQRQLDVAVVLGADSHYDPLVLEAHFERERVLDSEWREAFVPGEAATALVLARPQVARELGMTPMARLMSAATGEEVATRDDDVGLLGLGLSRPAVAVAKRLKREGRPLDWWLCDVTGETFRIQELQLAWPRASHIAMTPDGSLDMLPSHFGDLGAATMPTGVMLGCEGLRRGDPVGTTFLVSGSSDEGHRGVVLFEVIHPQRDAAPSSSRP